MVVKSGQVEYRLIRRWFAEEKRFCLWMTNLPRAAWSAEQVMSLYRCRWQVELLFSGNRTTGSKGFVTGEKAIAEGLVDEPAVAGDEETGRAECDEWGAIDAEKRRRTVHDVVATAIGSSGPAGR